MTLLVVTLSARLMDELSIATPKPHSATFLLRTFSETIFINASFDASRVLEKQMILSAVLTPMLTSVWEVSILGLVPGGRVRQGRASLKLSWQVVFGGLAPLNFKRLRFEVVVPWLSTVRKQIIVRHVLLNLIID